MNDDKKPNSTENDPAELDKTLIEKQKQVEQLTETAKELTQTVSKLRGDIRDFKLFKEEDVVEKPEKKEDDMLTEEEELDDKIERKMIQKEAESRTKMYNEVALEFVKEKEEFNPTNDIGGELLREFKKEATETFLGANEAQVRGKLERIFHGLLATKKALEEKKKPLAGLGEIESRETKDKEPDSWETKKLNKAEQRAAEVFPGGETAYRKKQAELAKRKG